MQDEEDSMHEKYFLPGNQPGMRSVESTPQARRKQTSLSSGSKSMLDNVANTPSHGRKSNKATMEHGRGRDNRRYNEDNESQTGSSGNESSNTSHSPVTTSPSRYVFVFVFFGI